MVKCPTCGEDYSEHGVKLHHAKSHGESYYAAIIRDSHGVEPDVFLKREHHENRRSLADIGDEIGTNASTVGDMCDRQGVSTRSYSQAQEDLWDERGSDKRQKMVEAAHEKTREQVANGEHNFQDPDFERVQTEEFREMAKGTGHALFRTNQNGYESWRANYNNGETDYVKVHRLLAVAKYGFDEVADMHVHHLNNIPWLNTYSNITLETPEDHAREHYKERDIDEQGRFK